MATKNNRVAGKLSEFERFRRLIRGLVAVPKKEIEAEEARWRANRRLKKKSVDT